MVQPIKNCGLPHPLVVPAPDSSGTKETPRVPRASCGMGASPDESGGGLGM